MLHTSFGGLLEFNARRASSFCSSFEICTLEASLEPLITRLPLVSVCWVSIAISSKSSYVSSGVLVLKEPPAKLVTIL